MDHVRLLRTADGEVTLSMIRGLLEEAGIPYYLRDRDFSSTLRICTGYTVYGTDVYVDEDDYERAEELVSGYMAPGAVLEDETLDEETRQALTEAAAEDRDDDRPTLEQMQSGTERALTTVSRILWGAGISLAVILLIGWMIWEAMK